MSALAVAAWEIFEPPWRVIAGHCGDRATAKAVWDSGAKAPILAQLHQEA